MKYCATCNSAHEEVLPCHVVSETRELGGIIQDLRRQRDRLLRERDEAREALAKFHQSEGIRVVR